MSLHCNICNVDVSSEVVMQYHVLGKRHVALQANAEKQHDVASRSVYVSGFTRSTSADQLRKLFEQFGLVKNVILDTEHAFFAIVEFTDSSIAADVLSNHKTIKLNKSVLTVRPRAVKTFCPRKKSEKKATEAKFVYEVCNLDVCADGVSVLDKLNKCQTVSEQIDMLVKHLQLNEDDELARSNVVTDLTQLFQEFSPACRIHPFGSSVSGFAFRGSDLDLFLDLNVNDMDISQTNTSTTTTSLMPPAVNVGIEKVSSYLRRHGDGAYHVLVTIGKTRCPVVKLVQRDYKLRCDLSISNRLGLRNSHFLRCVSAYDVRIRPLVLTIRYWAKCFNLAGSGAKLSNYALTLMIVHYLQNTTPPVLPSVQVMADCAGERCTVDGWDCSFPSDLTAHFPQSNESTVEDLLGGFFQFYAEFDFTRNVILVRDGIAIELAEFQTRLSGTNSEQEPQLNFKVSVMNIQDPFVLDHNIAGNVNEGTLTNIVSQLRHSASVCQSSNFHRLNSDHAKLLSAGVDSSKSVNGLAHTDPSGRVTDVLVDNSVYSGGASKIIDTAGIVDVSANDNNVVKSENEPANSNSADSVDVPTNEQLPESACVPAGNDLWRSVRESKLISKCEILDERDVIKNDIIDENMPQIADQTDAQYGLVLLLTSCGYTALTVKTNC